MPRYVFTENERHALKLYLDSGKADTIIGYAALRRLRKLTLSKLRADMALAEQVFERLQK